MRTFAATARMALSNPKRQLLNAARIGAAAPLTGNTMNIVTLKFDKCCECGARATKKLELLEVDERGAVGSVPPKHYCDAHFPEPLDDTQLRLLLDVRDSEIGHLKAVIGDLVLHHDIGGTSEEILAAWETARALC